MDLARWFGGKRISDKWEAFKRAGGWSKIGFQKRNGKSTSEACSSGMAGRFREPLSMRHVEVLVGEIEESGFRSGSSEYLSERKRHVGVHLRRQSGRQ